MTEKGGSVWVCRGCGDDTSFDIDTCSRCGMSKSHSVNKSEGFWGRTASRLSTKNKKLQAERDVYLEALVDVTRDKEGFPGAECLRKAKVGSDAIKAGRKIREGK